MRAVELDEALERVAEVWREFGQLVGGDVEVRQRAQLESGWE